jgi:CheY-like chemotaxis protein
MALPLSFRTSIVRPITRLSLLVVDGDAVTRAVICILADRSGFASIGAASLDEAELLLDSHTFDALTLDVAIGDHLGFEVMQAMAERALRVPIFVVSALPAAMLVESVAVGRSLGLNVCDPERKPISYTRMRRKLAIVNHRVAVGLCGCCGGNPCDMRADCAIATTARHGRSGCVLNDLG